MMKSIMKAISMLLEHFYKNRSNYCLIIGVFFVLKYIYTIYGLETLFLLIGILLILTSFIIEANKLSNRR